MITKEQYAQKQQTEVDTLSAEIENLAAEIKEAEEKDDSEGHVNVFRQHRDEAKTTLTEIQAAGDDGLEDFKYGLKHTWMAMKDNFAKIMSRLTS